MKKLVYSIFLFVSITLLLNIVLQIILDRTNRKIPSGWNKCYQLINAEVLILGSSRAVHHISPKIIDTCLKVNSYNLGNVGTHFLIQNCSFKSYLRKNKLPKNIIHSLDISTLIKGDILFNSKEYIPYLEDTLVAKYTSSYKGSFNKWHHNMPIYKYNNALPSLIRPLMRMIGLKEPNKTYKGYLPNDITWEQNKQNQKKTYIPNPHRIDTETVKEFETYLMFCKKENINLIFVYSPEYIGGQKQKEKENKNEIISLYQQYANRYNLCFLDYSEDSLCYNKSLFYDMVHLNKKGSEAFTTKLAYDLKACLK